MTGKEKWRRVGHITGRRPDVNSIPIEAEVEQEHRFHLEALTGDLIAEGWDPEEARREALRRFGDLEAGDRQGRRDIQSRDRRLRLVRFFEDRRSDAHLALRTLHRYPGFSLVVIITLALGIGANTAIFSVVQGVLLAPLPYPDSEQLIMIDERAPEGWFMGFSPPNFEDLRQRSTLLQEVGTYYPRSATLTGQGDPEVVAGLRVSAGFFEMLGALPVIGRPILSTDDEAGAEPVVLLGHAFWSSRFGGRESIIGESITLDGEPHTVIGVLPADFHFEDGEVNLCLPCAWTGQDRLGRGRHWLRVLARLKPGVEFAAAVDEVEGIAADLAVRYPATNDGWQWRVRPLLSTYIGNIRAPLLMLLGAVLMVLLIACANVTNLTLARAETRRREMAVRLALGAGRRRLLLQMLTESFVLALFGGIIGIALAWLGIELIVRGLGTGLPRSAGIGMNHAVLLFTAGISVLAGVVVGLAPAFSGSRRDILTGLRSGERPPVPGRGRFRLQSVLVVAEVALALTLLVGAGLLLRSLDRLLQVEVGFEPDHLLITEISLPAARYPTPEHARLFHAELRRTIERLPAFTSISGIDGLPFRGGRSHYFEVAGRPDIEPIDCQRRYIEPGYFETMQIPLLTGRRPDSEQDTPQTPTVAIINASFARQMFSDDDPLGQRVRYQGDSEDDGWEIIGVVGDVRQYGLETESFPGIYLSNLQFSTPRSMTLVIRTADPPRETIADLREVVGQLDPELPLAGITTFENIISDSVAPRRLQVILLGLFAAIALSLCMVGLYGLLSWLVTSRTAEIGIRSALGAGRSGIIWLITGRGLLLTGVGILVGTVCAGVLSRLIAGLLYDVSPGDPMVYIGVGVVLLVVSTAAGYLPARRATAIDPASTLRQE